MTVPDGQVLYNPRMLEQLLVQLLECDGTALVRVRRLEQSLRQLVQSLLAQFWEISGDEEGGT